MRVWDIPVGLLCWTHLNGQHREIHGINGSITKYYANGSKGYSNHPETRRWIGREQMLFHKHEETAMEMLARQRNHRSPLVLIASDTYDDLPLVDSLFDQIQNIKDKSEDPNHKCTCNIGLMLEWYGSISCQ